MSTGDLISTYFKVKIYNIQAELYVICNYYKKIRFCLIDLSLHFIYLFFNPYRISKNFLKKKNFPNIHLYGETPLSSFESIVKESHILPSHSFWELGAGRGRCSFWLSQFVGCKVDAVEWIPFFYKTSKFISKLFGLKTTTFYCQDMYTLEFKNTDFIFLYGTCLEDREIFSLIDSFKKLDEKVKIITVSYPLSDYDLSFQIKKQFPVSFPWGETDCFVNIRK